MTLRVSALLDGLRRAGANLEQLEGGYSEARQADLGTAGFHILVSGEWMTRLGVSHINK